MIPRITITRTWSDDDVAQLTFEVCDGVSVFTNEAYAALDWGAAAAAALRTFGEQIHGGLFDLEAGKEGLEYATATMFLRTEPSLLDQFIAALPALDAPDGGQAVLQCVPLPDDA